jgi:hypothetical protein
MKRSGSTALLYVATVLLLAAGVTVPASATSAAPAIGSVVTPADWPFAIYRLTDDDLTQHSVRVAGPNVYWCENRQVPQGDGSVMPTPPVVRYLNRDTGARALVDPGPAGIWDLAAGGDWVVYQRDDATSTVVAWNPNTGEHRTVATEVRLTDNPATDGTHITWREFTHDADASEIEYKVVIDTIAPGPSTDIADDAVCTPAVDQGVVAWVTLDASDNGSSTLRTYDIRTGTRSSVRIPSFSALYVDISGPLVIAAGEDHRYTSHIYVWDTVTGQVRNVYSAPVRTASIGSAYVAGTRVVFEETPLRQFRRIRTLDVATGAVADVSPPDLWASLWSLDGSVAGMIIKRPGWTVEAAWCDLAARRPAVPANDSGALSDVTAPTSASARRSGPFLVAEAEPADDTAEATMTTEATRTAGNEPGLSDSNEAPASGSALGGSDEDRDSWVSWPMAALVTGIAVLTVLGGAMYAARRRSQRTEVS